MRYDPLWGLGGGCEGLSGTGLKRNFSAIRPSAWTSAAQLFSHYIEGPWLPLLLPLPSHLGLEGVVLGEPPNPLECQCVIVRKIGCRY